MQVLSSELLELAHLARRTEQSNSDADLDAAGNDAPQHSLLKADSGFRWPPHDDKGTGRVRIFCARPSQSPSEREAISEGGL